MNSFETLFWPALFIAVLLVIVPFIARERKKTGIRDEKASFRRLFAIAVIISIVAFAVLAVVITFSPNGLADSPTPARELLAEMPDLLLAYGVILFTCLGVVAFIYVMRGFELLYQRCTETLRRTMASALLCLIPIVWGFLFGGSEITGRTLVVLGILLGLATGSLMAKRWKRKIVGDRIIYRRRTVKARSFKESLAYWWKEEIAAAAGIAIGCAIVFYLVKGELVSLYQLDGAFFGLMIGISLYGFVWAYLYEKRTGVRLKFERGDPSQSADSPAA